MRTLIEAVAVSALILTGAVIWLMFWALSDRRQGGPDAGVAIFAEDCTMLHDCDGCDECGAPMVVDEQAEAGIDLAYYGTRVVHRQCLTARRDNGTPCADCAKILAAVAQ